MAITLSRGGDLERRLAVQTDPNRTLSQAQPPRVATSAPVLTPPTRPTDVGGMMPARTPVLADPRAAAPGSQPTLTFPTFGPGNDLRSSQLATSFSPQHATAIQAAAQAARVNAAAPLAPTDLTAARGLLGTAQGEVGGIQAGPDIHIAATDLAGARQNLGAAQGQVGALTGLAQQQVAPGAYAPSSAADRARVLASGGLETVYGAPDRTALALRALQLEEERAAPAYADRLRQIGQKAAAFGRTRSGMTTNDLTGVEQDHARGMNQLRESLLINAGEQTLADRLAQLNAAVATGSQFRGEDLADARMQEELRNEARSELSRQMGALGGVIDTNRALSADELGLAGVARGDAEADRQYAAQQAAARAAAAAQRAGLYNQFAGTEGDFAQIGRQDAESDRAYGLNVDQINASLGLQGAQVLRGLDQDAYGRAITATQEQRAERDYQTQLAQQAMQDRINQAMMEDQLQNSALARQLELAQAQYQATGDDSAIRAILAAAQGGGGGGSDSLSQLAYAAGLGR